MQSEALTLYKLIILFILNSVDFPITNAQISDFILDNGYANYFNIQQSISELCSTELIISQKIRNRSYFKITEAGSNTLELFSDRISDEIKKEIKDYLKAHKFKLRSEVSNIADYYKSSKDSYSVRCQVKEKNTSIIDITLVVPTQTQAEDICKNWEKKNQQIYAYLMKTLMN